MNGKNFLKGAVVWAAVNGLAFNALAGSKKAAKTIPTPEINVSRKALLNNSQISYQAEGGFTGVQSYGIIISCVKGRISVLKSIHDPRLAAENSRVRQLASMSANSYLDLWDKLEKSALLKMKDAPNPSMDIADEFTIHFYAKIGSDHHQFKAYGLSRPETSRYYAIRQLIDESVNMAGLWNQYSALAQNMEKHQVPRHAAATAPF